MKASVADLLVFLLFAVGLLWASFEAFFSNPQSSYELLQMRSNELSGLENQLSEDGVISVRLYSTNDGLIDMQFTINDTKSCRVQGNSATASLNETLCSSDVSAKDSELVASIAQSLISPTKVQKYPKTNFLNQGDFSYVEKTQLEQAEETGLDNERTVIENGLSRRRQLIGELSTSSEDLFNYFNYSSSFNFSFFEQGESNDVRYSVDYKLADQQVPMTEITFGQDIVDFAKQSVLCKEKVIKILESERDQFRVLKEEWYTDIRPLLIRNMEVRTNRTIDAERIRDKAAKQLHNLLRNFQPTTGPESMRTIFSDIFKELETLLTNALNYEKSVKNTLAVYEESGVNLAQTTMDNIESTHDLSQFDASSISLNNNVPLYEMVHVDQITVEALQEELAHYTVLNSTMIEIVWTETQLYHLFHALNFSDWRNLANMVYRRVEDIDSSLLVPMSDQDLSGPIDRLNDLAKELTINCDIDKWVAKFNQFTTYLEANTQTIKDFITSEALALSKKSASIPSVAETNQISINIVAPYYTTQIPISCDIVRSNTSYYTIGEESITLHNSVETILRNTNDQFQRFDFIGDFSTKGNFEATLIVSTILVLVFMKPGIAADVKFVKRFIGKSYIVTTEHLTLWAEHCYSCGRDTCCDPYKYFVLKTPVTTYDKDIPLTEESGSWLDSILLTFG